MLVLIKLIIQIFQPFVLLLLKKGLKICHYNNLYDEHMNIKIHILVIVIR